MKDKEAGKIYVTVIADTKALEEKLRIVSEALEGLADRLAEVDREPDKECYGNHKTGDFNCQDCWHENKDLCERCIKETKP